MFGVQIINFMYQNLLIISHKFDHGSTSLSATTMVRTCIEELVQAHENHSNRSMSGCL